MFSDVLPVLKRLKTRYKLGLISNTDRFSASGLFEGGYDKWFDAISLSFETGILKPDPEIFRLTLKRLGTRPEETVMVGDSLKDDIKGAENVGMRAVLIKRRFKYPPSHLEKGTYRRVIKSLDELERYLG